MEKLKKLAPYAFYGILMLLFAFGEKALSGHYFSLGFLCALAFRRKNLLPLLPIYMVSVALAQWSFAGILYAVLPVVAILLFNLIFFKLGKTANVLAYNLFTLFLSLEFFIFSEFTILGILYSGLSVVSSVLTLNVANLALCAIENRGMRWKLSPVEWLSIALFVMLTFVAVTKLNVAGFPILPLLAAFTICLSVAGGPSTALVTGALIGLSASLIELNFSITAQYFAIAIGVVLGKRHPLISALFGTASFILVAYLSSFSINYLSWISAGVGCGFSFVLWRTMSPYFKSISRAQQKEQGNRFLINRARLDVADKLGHLSAIFQDMEEVLRLNGTGGSLPSTERITRNVQSENCKLCAKRHYCEDTLGGSMSVLIGELIHCATERGKASILDTPPFLSANCTRLSTVLDSVNWNVKELNLRSKKEQNNRIIKELMSKQMGGVAEILKELSDDVSRPISYDSTIEKKLISELNYLNVSATDAILFKDKNGLCLTLQLADESSDDGEILSVVNRVLATKMSETKREKNVQGSITVNYDTSPRFNITYGEYSLPLKGDDKSGDTIEAVHISKNKVMLLLSDGMGSGDAAYRTSRLAVSLLESFYKAGFSHNTVMYSASRLLTLKGDETFNAVDLALVDLLSGSVDFIKLGGREGYIKTAEGVEIVPCGSLPLGIVDEVVPVITRKKLRDGDYFVMLSDGVADILDREQIEVLLKTTPSVNPNLIATEIVENALTLGGKKDDMSCVVGRIFLSA